MSADLEVETVPGLPHDLPPGEHIVWQGRPNWKALARNTFRVHWVAAYFLIFGLTRAAVAVKQGESLLGALFPPFALAVFCLAVLCGLACLNARAAVYTVTSRRVVLRVGIAIPTSWNLPFARLASADLAVRPEGDGDIVMHLKAPDKVAWLHLWPHTQPWHFSNARPTLRTIDQPGKVAELLSDAIRRWAEVAGSPLIVSRGVATSPESSRSDERMSPNLLEAGR